MKTVNSKRYTDHILVSRRAMRNSGWLAAYVQNMLLAKFVQALNTGVIAGTGGGSTLNGLLNQASTFSGAAFANLFANADYFSVIRAAMGELRKTYHRVANSLFVDPVEYAVMADARTTIGDFISRVNYLSGGAGGFETINGLNVVQAAAVTDGGYMVAEVTPQTVQLLFNGPIEILATDSHGDNFTKNLITLKIEADVMLPIYKATAFLKGSFDSDKATIAKV